MTSDYHFIENINTELPDIPSKSIISRTVFSSDSIKVILFGFAVGEELSEHTSAKPAIMHFIKGDADITLGDEPQSAQAGTWVHMPANMPHSVLAKTPVTMILYLMQ